MIENIGMERALKIAEKIRSEIYEAKSVDSVRCPDLKVSISIGQLHASPHFHIQPINVVVFNGSLEE